MKALRENGFSVPEPIAQNRHTIVMGLIDAFPLRQISKVADPAKLYSELMNMILELARFGLIHGDFNEFNILIKEEQDPDAKGKAPASEEEEDDDDENLLLTPVLIDFPQMVSVDHTNAEMYFDRDVECIKRYFKRKFKFVSDKKGPTFAEARKLLLKNPGKRLDIEVEASGFSRKMAKELEAYMKEVGATGDGEESKNSDEEEEDDDEEVSSGSDDELSDTDETQKPGEVDVDDNTKGLEELRVSESSAQ